jgi:nucleoside-diphosphate-sugar epimerase
MNTTNYPTISIIGGAGFIGSRLCLALRRFPDARFVIVDKVKSQCCPDESRIADVRSIEDLRTAIPEKAVLINLAAEHRDDVTPRSLYHDVNVQGAKNICAVATEKRVSTIIFTSSVAVYGFAQIGTNELGPIDPFNDYGKTKFEAEQVFRTWQSEAPADRSLGIIRPTVVFGEQNRGNVYNLLRQIASGRFLMVGDGGNRKSIAYVENVVAFIRHAMSFGPGVHTYNYVDKPDFTMNSLIGQVNSILGKPQRIRFRLPFAFGYSIGRCFDLAAAMSGRKFPISSIRVRKFCIDSVYDSAIDSTGFVPPVSLPEALRRTIHYEFVESHASENVFYTE